MSKQTWEWINKFSETPAYSDRCALLSTWIQDVYDTEKVILFFHGSGRLRYSLVRSIGIPSKELSTFNFSEQKYIHNDLVQNEDFDPTRSFELDEWEWFNDDLSSSLKKIGLNRILPLWVGRQCIGGIIIEFDSSKLNQNEKAFESISSDIAYLLEIAYIDQLYQRQTWEKKVLLEVGQKISSFSDLQSVLDHMIDSLREVISYDAAGIFLVNNQSKSIEYKTIRGYTPNMREMVDLKVGKGIVGWSIKNGQEINVQDVLKDSRYVSAHNPTRSELVVPIVYGSEVIGAFNLESNNLAFFRYRHIEILRAFAAQTAIVLKNSMMLYRLIEVKQVEKELEIARGIQNTLLPQEIPPVEGYDIAAENCASRTIGGDLYDVVELSGEEVGIAIGDVSGKGIPGALLMASVFTMYREEIRQNIETDKVVRGINSTLYKQIESDKFATFFYGVLNFEKNIFKYTNAGHNPPVMLYNNGKSIELTTGGPILGFISDTRYFSDSIVFNSGDVLLLYTDGLSETLSSDDEEFGEDRILECLKKCNDLSAREIKEYLLLEIQNFAKKTNHDDDLTMVVIKKL